MKKILLWWMRFSPGTWRKKHIFWMYTVSDIINALTNAGLHIINYFNEYKENFFNASGMKSVGNGLFNLEYNIDKFPMVILA